MGIFIKIDFDEQSITPDFARRLEQLCPVDIFQVEGGQLVVNADNEDECTLCRLCLQAAPPGALRVHKLYSGETLVSTGDA
jgi:NAD-dependent dihydropyrimidine dehydrogenase PreA subunit